jgi:hypothetical protein
MSSSAAIRSIVTHRNIAAPLARVWASLRFYEEVAAKPPLLLRLLLPRPLRTPTAARAPGDETILPYVDGHYSKRVTTFDPPHRHEFEVIEQQLAADHGVTMLGGTFTLRELPSHHTDLAVGTSFRSRLRPRWLAEPLESLLCRRLQTYLLDAIEAESTGK